MEVCKTKTTEDRGIRTVKIVTQNGSGRVRKKVERNIILRSHSGNHAIAAFWDV